MIAELFAAAFFGTTVYLKAKQNAKKSNSSWHELDKWEKLEALSNGALNCLEDKADEQKKSLKREIQSWNSDQLLKALQNLEPSDWRYDIVENELKKR